MIVLKETEYYTVFNIITVELLGFRSLTVNYTLQLGNNRHKNASSFVFMKMITPAVWQEGADPIIKCNKLAKCCSLKNVNKVYSFQGRLFLSVIHRLLQTATFQDGCFCFEY